MGGDWEVTVGAWINPHPSFRTDSGPGGHSSSEDSETEEWGLCCQKDLGPSPCCAITAV